MKRAWARWLLVVSNALGALACVVVGILAMFAEPDDRIGDGHRAYSILALISLIAIFGTAAYLQSQRRGRVMQTLLAMGSMFVWLLTSWWPLALYGTFTFVATWWLGDFLTGDEPAPLTGTPSHVARVLWRRGQTTELIRTELAARNVPADEIEKLVYELAVEEEQRQRMSPGA